MSKSNLFIILFLITMLGGVLRFWEITNNPPSLNIDEVAVGYNAYSILKTGKDEYGNFLPLSFKSVGDYKPPISIYLTIPFIAIFGLNEFGVRSPAAFISTISIPIYFYVFYILLSETIFNNEKTKKGKEQLIAHCGAGITAISCWYIYYSRYAASEFLISTLLVSLGLTLLIKSHFKNILLLIISAFCFSLSMYTYHTERLFVPLFIIFILFMNMKNIWKLKKNILIFLAIIFILLLPLLIGTILGEDKTRAQDTFITRDINFIRQVSLTNQFGVFDYFLLIFYWARKYLAYFQPSFLFFNGLNMTLPGTIGLGIMYLFEIPWFLLGIYSLLTKKVKNSHLIIAWVLLGLIPASLTMNEEHASRTLVILPAIILISAIGVVKFFELLNKTNKLFRNVILAGFSLVIIWNFIFAFFVFTVHFPNQRSEAFMDGSKEIVNYAIAHQNDYEEIIFDPYRGIQAPDIVSIPHIYLLFYSKYSPKTYQAEKKELTTEYYHFNKFTFRRINWVEDRKTSRKLYIGSPWSFAVKDFRKQDVVKKVYLKNGKLAFLIVAPNKD